MGIVDDLLKPLTKNGRGFIPVNPGSWVYGKESNEVAILFNGSTINRKTVRSDKLWVFNLTHAEARHIFDLIYEHGTLSGRGVFFTADNRFYTRAYADTMGIIKALVEYINNK